MENSTHKTRLVFVKNSIYLLKLEIMWTMNTKYVPVLHCKFVAFRLQHLQLFKVQTLAIQTSVLTRKKLYEIDRAMDSHPYNSAVRYEIRGTIILCFCL